MNRFANLCCTAAIALGIGLVPAYGQKVSGRVYDAIGGNSLAGVPVTIAELSKTLLTNPEGQFEFDSINPGTYLLKAELPGFLKVSRKFSLASQTEVGSSSLVAEIPLYKLAPSSDKEEAGMSISYMFPGRHDIVQILIYDSKSKIVRTVLDARRMGGVQKFVWDGKDNGAKTVAPGTYSCKITSGNSTMIRNLVFK